MLIKAFNIEWDKDNDSPDLPSEAFFKVDNSTTKREIEEELANWLSDEYNYLVNVCEWEVIV